MKRSRMTESVLNGDEAMALGAMASGVKMVTSYPGSPSSGTVETIIGMAKKHDVYVEWSSNEKVALEMGIGASMAGRRALVCVKSVGMNAMIDPLMVLNLAPVHGGLVILLGDDPGAYGSQNDQDSRPLAPFLRMPMLEPAGAAEAYAMMREAFAVSEKFHTAVIIRETRSFTQQREKVTVFDRVPERIDRGLVRDPFRFVPVPKNAVEKNNILNETIGALTEWANETGFNTITGEGVKGIVAAGFTHQKILDILGGEVPDDFRLLKLGVVFPLPSRTIAQFFRNCEDVLVVEENSAYVETGLKAIAHESGCMIRIYGKSTGHFVPSGELYRWQIQDALIRWFPGFVPAQTYTEENESEERPDRSSFCTDCRYDEVLDKLSDAAGSLNQNPVLVADPGCIVTVADRIHAKYAMGSAVAVADGLSKSGCQDRAVAIFGDSSFFHTTLPAICNVVHNRSDVLMVILDNQASTASGFQPNPGVAENALGEGSTMLDIGTITRACGVNSVITVNLDDSKPSLTEVFKKALDDRRLTAVIVRIPKRETKLE